MKNSAMLNKMQAILEPAGRKFQVRFVTKEGLVQETEAQGRVRLKKFLRLLHQNGYECFNEKKNGRVVKLSAIN